MGRGEGGGTGEEGGRDRAVVIGLVDRPLDEVKSLEPQRTLRTRRKAREGWEPGNARRKQRGETKRSGDGTPG